MTALATSGPPTQPSSFRASRSLLRRLLLLQFHPLVERVRRSTIARQLLGGAFWSVAGGIASRALLLIASVALARILGTESFGQLGIILSTIGMFGTLAGFGLGTTATKHVAELRGGDPLRAGRILTLSTRFSVAASATGAAALALAAPWLAGASLAAPQLAGPLRASSLLLFLSGVSGAQLGALAGLRAFRSIAAVNVSQAAVAAPMTVVGAWAWGLDGVVWSMNLGMLVACVLGGRALHQAGAAAGVRTDAPGWWDERAILWRFSLPATMSAALVGLVNWACAAILVNQERGYVEMGVFNAANQWFMALLFVPGLVGQAVLPVMSAQAGLDARGVRLRIMRRLMAVNSLVFLPAAVLCALSPAIVRLYGPEFAGRWMALAGSVLTAGILSVQTPVGQVITASGRVWTGFAMNLGWAAIFLIATMLFVAPWGADGLVAARLLAYVLHAVWTLGFAARSLS